MSTPMLTTASAVDERLREMNDKFLASLQGLGGRRGDRKGHDRSSTGSSTARAPSSGTSTVGRRTLDPLTFARQQDTNSPPLSRRQSGTAGGINVALPAARPAAAILWLFTFMATWTDFFWPLIVLPASNPTVQIALQQLQSGYYVDYSLVLAGAAISTIPLLVLFVL